MDKASVPGTTSSTTQNLQRIGTEVTKSSGILLNPAQFILGFLKWWYLDSITNHLRFFKRAIELLWDRLSIGLLIRTFFVPWHRDRTFMGVAFGIIMRIIWLPIAFATLFVVAILGAIFILAWLIMPVITIYNIIFFWL